MLEAVTSQNRRLVTIIDPHVKEDPEFFLYKEASQRGVLVRKADKKSPYSGRCWPEYSGWIDFLNPLSLALKRQLYGKDISDIIPDNKRANFIWNKPEVGIWIDMNEPACFEKTDKTMPKSNYHLIQMKGEEEPTFVEHRDVHSLYGYFSTMVTFNALLHRS